MILLNIAMLSVFAGFFSLVVYVFAGGEVWPLSAIPKPFGWWMFGWLLVYFGCMKWEEHRQEEWRKRMFGDEE